MAYFPEWLDHSGWFWAAAVSWAPGQPWNHERKQPTHLRSFCTHTTILVFTFSVCVLSRCCRVRLFVTLWTVAHRAPLSLEFSRQEYWSGLPCPPPGTLPHPGIEPVSYTSPSLAGRFFTTSITREAPLAVQCSINYMRFSTLLYKIDLVLDDFSHL